MVVIRFEVNCKHCGCLNSRHYQGKQYPKTFICDRCGKRQEREVKK